MKKIPITQAAPDLPPVPRPLVEKANALYTYLMHSRAPLGEQLQAVYRYTDEFSLFIAQFMSCSKGVLVLLPYGRADHHARS